MLLAETSVAASFEWTIPMRIAMRSRTKAYGMAVPGRSRLGCLSRIFLRVAVGVYVTYVPVVLASSPAPPADGSSTDSVQLSPVATAAPGHDQQADMLVPARSVLVHSRDSKPSVITGQETRDKARLAGVPGGEQASAGERAQAGLGAGPFAIFSHSPRVVNSESDSAIPPRPRFPPQVNAATEGTATTTAPFAFPAGTSRRTVHGTEALSGLSEIELREKLRQVREQQQRVTHELEQVLYGQHSIAAVARAEPKPAARQHNAESLFETAPYAPNEPAALPKQTDSPAHQENDNAESVSEPALYALSELPPLQNQTDHENKSSGSATPKTQEPKSPAGDDDTKPGGTDTPEGVGQRLHRLRELQADLKTEETELQRRLDKYAEQKAEASFENQKQDRAASDVRNRFEPIQEDAERRPGSGTPSPAASKRSRRRRRRQQRLALREAEGSPKRSRAAQDEAARRHADSGNDASRETEPDAEKKGYSTDEDVSATERTASLEARLGHARPVIPQDRGSASPRSDSAPSTSRPRSTAFLASVRLHDPTAVLLEVHGKEGAASPGGTRRGGPSGKSSTPAGGRTSPGKTPQNRKQSEGSSTHPSTGKAVRAEKRAAPSRGGSRPPERDIPGQRPSRIARETRPTSTESGSSSDKDKLRRTDARMRARPHSPTGGKRKGVRLKGKRAPTTSKAGRRRSTGKRIASAAAARAKAAKTRLGMLGRRAKQGFQQRGKPALLKSARSLRGALKTLGGVAKGAIGLAAAHFAGGGDVPEDTEDSSGEDGAGELSDDGDSDGDSHDDSLVEGEGYAGEGETDEESAEEIGQTEQEEVGVEEAAAAEDQDEENEDPGWAAVEISAQRPSIRFHATGSSTEAHSGGHSGGGQYEDDSDSDDDTPWQPPQSEEGDEEGEQPDGYDGSGGNAASGYSEDTDPKAFNGGSYTESPPRGGMAPARKSGTRLDSLYTEPKKHKHRTFEDFGRLDKQVGRPDWIKEASTSSNADDVRWESRQKLQIRSDDEVYDQAHDTIPGLNYLGAGYDVLKGNPLGDAETSVDPGFRSPVLRFQWAHDAYGVTNDLALLQPVGGYVRPFVSCTRSEALDEISSLSDYQNELSVDAKVQAGTPFVSFSAGAGYKQMAKDIAKKDQKKFMLKTYCFRYEAGLASAPQIRWNTTYGFEHAILDLSTGFEGLEPGSGCPPSVYKVTPTSDACRHEGVTGWMDLFNQYGTHVTTNLKLGGKITHSITMKKESLDALKDKGVSVSAAVSGGGVLFSAGGSTSTSTSSSSREATSSEDRRVSTKIVGGRPPKDPTDPAMLVLWSKTVEDLPMPVRIQLQPLSAYMPPEFRPAYDKALVYYGRAFGVSQAELDGIFGNKSTTIAQRLHAAHSIVWGGAAPGYVECPGEELILFGFSAVYNFRDLEADPSEYHIVACEPGRRRCEGPRSPGLPADEARTWMVCASNEIVSLRSVVVESTEEEEHEDLELQCPAGAHVLVGVKLAAGYGPGGALGSYIEHCITGKSVCTMEPRPAESRRRVRRFIYAACLEDTYPGGGSIHAVSSMGDVGPANNQKKDNDGSVVLNCGAGQVFLFGWTLETHTRAEEVRKKFQNCTPGQQMCLMRGAGINKAPAAGAVRRFTDTHALLGFGLCVAPSSFNDHPAAHSTAIEKAGSQQQKPSTAGATAR